MTWSQELAEELAERIEEHWDNRRILYRDAAHELLARASIALSAKVTAIIVHAFDDGWTGSISPVGIVVDGATVRSGDVLHRALVQLPDYQWTPELDGADVEDLLAEGFREQRMSDPVWEFVLAAGPNEGNWQIACCATEPEAEGRFR